jgi:hypothetical protein
VSTPHTPGPWTLGGAEGTRVYAHPCCLAEAWGGLDDAANVGPTTLANARLIAAAPELLDSVKEMYETLLSGMATDYDEMAAQLGRARALIDRIEGQS